MTNLEAVLQQKLKDLQNDYHFMVKVGTAHGFMQHFFEQLKNYKTALDCFNSLNDKYEKIYGEPRYSDWASFAKMKNYYFKKQQKK